GLGVEAWRLGSRCILLDFTYFFVWSRFLAFVCLLTATILLGEEGFYSIFNLPSSSSCHLARGVGLCDAEGVHRAPSSGVVLTLNPVESLQLHVEKPGIWALRLVVAASAANSRYLRCWPRLDRCFCALVLACCLLHFLGSAADLRHCDATRSPPGRCGLLAPRWAAGSPDWPGPSEEADQVLRYCVVSRARRFRPSPGGGAEEDAAPLEEWEQQRREDERMTESVRDMWAAWVDRTAFVVSFANRSLLVEYCQSLLQVPELHTCLAWLNSSSHGNSIRCPRADDGAILLDQERLQMLSAALAASASGGGGGRLGRLAMLDSVLLEAQLDGLVLRGCEAWVNGSTFALRARWPFSGMARPEVVGEHLLARRSRRRRRSRRSRPSLPARRAPRRLAARPAWAWRSGRRGTSRGA
ncbi:unnamed protein product, partial [Prorocentrum cordatum]